MRLIILIGACLMFMAATGQDTAKLKPKQYLGVLTLTEKYRSEKNWTKADEAIVGEHFQRLVKFKNEGIVLLAGRTELALDNTDMMGLVVFEAANDVEAQRFMDEDPAVKNKIMQVKVHPYSVAISKCK